MELNDLKLEDFDFGIPRGEKSPIPEYETKRFDVLPENLLSFQTKDFEEILGVSTDDSQRMILGGCLACLKEAQVLHLMSLIMKLKEFKLSQEQTMRILRL